MNEKAPFNSWAVNYRRNHTTGQNLRVVPAKVHHDDGHESGIAVFNGQQVFLVLTAEHAHNLAHAIADVLNELPAA